MDDTGLSTDGHLLTHDHSISTDCGLVTLYIASILVSIGTGNGLLPAWWRHQMETFSVLLALCAGNSLVSGEFHAQRPVTRSFDVFFDLRLNKRVSKQWWGWWFDTPSHPLWCHCNGLHQIITRINVNLLSTRSSDFHPGGIVYWNTKDINT